MYAADLQWTTGDDSDDTAALAGFSAGDGKNFHIISGSLRPTITGIARISNVGTPGTWIFKVGGMHAYT